MIAARCDSDVEFTQTVHKRHIGARQDFCRSLDRGAHRGRLIVDQYRGRLVPTVVIEEPCTTEPARTSGVDNALALRIKFDVIAQAATVRARGILDHGPGHRVSAAVNLS
jgi:hypothetical protein